MKTKTAILFSMAIGWVCAEPPRFTLHGAVKAALGKNPALLRQGYDVEAAQKDITTAALRPNPQLNVNGDMVSAGLPGDGPGGLLQPQNKMYGVSLSVPFETAGKRGKRVANAQWNYAVSQKSLEDAKRQTAAAAANAWLDVYQAKLNLDLNLKAKALLDSLVAVNRTRLRNQVITATDLARSIVAARQYEIQVDEAGLGVARAVRTLAFLLGMGAGDSLEVDMSDTLEEVSFQESTLDSAVATRSDVAMAKNALEAAKANYGVQKALAAPDFSVSTDFSEQQGVPFYGLSLSVGLPLFSRNQGEIGKAESLLRQGEFTVAAQKNLAQYEIHSALDEYRVHEREKDLALLNLQESEKVLRTVEYSYRSGSTTILDFLDAQRTWYDTRQAYNDTWISLRRSAVRMSSSLGVLP